MFKIFIIFILQYVSPAKAQNVLVAHWNFDSLSGDTIYDLSSNANHGFNYGGTQVKGIKGNAVAFDGISGYIRIPGDGEAPPSVLADLGVGSISLWFKADNIPIEYGIAPLLYYGAEQKCDFFDAANKGLIIELGHSPIFHGSKELFYTVWKNGCTYPSFCFDSHNPVSINEWHHFVVVVGKDYNTGYLNGVEMTNRDYNFGNSSYSHFFEDAVAHEKMWLGKGHWDRTTQFFDGAIDELKIFNKPLSPSEVQSLYQENENDTSSGAFNSSDDQGEVV
ncbi:MAG TPA: LamG domain-containing protein, partial [Prolixibacteraceae bacterium]|nr:LamG domain-containing protein [Prolixibacteraceae bacterium]